MSVWTTANTSGLETPTKSPLTSSVLRTARNSAVITSGNHQQHHFQHVVAAAVAAATSVATGHQFQQQFPLHAHPHPHPQHHSNSPTGSGSNSNNSAAFQRTSISNSLLQFPPPPPPSSQNQAKFLLLFLLTFPSAYSNEGKKGLQRTLYITDNYHQNVVSIRTRKHIRYWGDNHFCAGSLLSAWWVVTSGCCVSTVPESTPNKSNSRKNLRVVVFTPSRLKKPSPKDVFHVQKIVLDETTIGGCSQLALLKLDRGVSGQRFAMMLPEKELNRTWLCSSLGWGRIYYNGPYSNELIQIRAQKISSYSCKPDCNRCLCMGSYTGRGNMCQQDLGSPLYCDHFLYGVARRRQTCEDEGFMLYTNIFRSRKFIEDTLSGAPSPKNSYAFVYFFVKLVLAFSFSVISSAWIC